MVIKVLINAWRSREALRRMFAELLQMLDATEWMFQTLGQVLFEGRDPTEVASRLYETDLQVNKTERKIRKEIVEHLSIGINRGVRILGIIDRCIQVYVGKIDAYRKNRYSKGNKYDHHVEQQHRPA